VPAFTNAQEALIRASGISDELVSLHGELAMVKQQSLSAGTDAFAAHNAAGENVTSCREHARQAASHYERMLVHIQGGIDQLLIEWRYIDQYITFHSKAK